MRNLRSVKTLMRRPEGVHVLVQLITKDCLGLAFGGGLLGFAFAFGGGLLGFAFAFGGGGLLGFAFAFGDGGLLGFAFAFGGGGLLGFPFGQPDFFLLCCARLLRLALQALEKHQVSAVQRLVLLVTFKAAVHQVFGRARRFGETLGE